MPFSRPIAFRRAGKLFESVDRALLLDMMTRMRRQFAVAHATQFPAQISAEILEFGA